MKNQKEIKRGRHMGFKKYNSLDPGDVLITGEVAVEIVDRHEGLGVVLQR